MAFLFTTNPAAPDFELDSMETEKRSDKYKVTKYPIETGANVTDHVEDDGKNFSLTGTLFAMSSSDSALIPGRVTNLRDALDLLAARRDVVTMVSEFNVRKVVISGWSEEHGPQSGDSLKVTIDLENVNTAGYAYTQIPASRLKPKIARRTATTSAKGGVSSPKPAAKTHLAKLLIR